MSHHKKQELNVTHEDCKKEIWKLRDQLVQYELRIKDTCDDSKELLHNICEEYKNAIKEYVDCKIDIYSDKTYSDSLYSAIITGIACGLIIFFLNTICSWILG